jgi:hypothetical protein
MLRFRTQVRDRSVPPPPGRDVMPDVSRMMGSRPDQVDPILIAANLELTAEDAAEIEGSTR